VLGAFNAESFLFLSFGICLFSGIYLFSGIRLYSPACDAGILIVDNC